MFVRHPYLLLELPSTFRPVSVTAGVVYAFREGDVEVEVRIETCPALATARRRVEAAAAGLAGVVRREEGHTFEVAFSRASATSIEHARIATTLVAMPAAEVGVEAYVHPVVAIRLRAASDPDGELLRLVGRAVVAPHAASYGRNARVQETSLRNLYPWVVTPAYITQRDALFTRGGLLPEGAFGLPRIGEDLYLALAQSRADGLRVLFPSDIARDSLDWSRCLEHARQNLVAKVGTAELPVAVHPVPAAATLEPSVAPWRGYPLRGPAAGMVLVVGESWLAASCLATSELWRGAAERLGTDRLMALVPNRDRLFVFADQGEVKNAQLAHAIRLVERDAPQQLSPTMFRLEPDAFTARRSA